MNNTNNIHQSDQQSQELDLVDPSGGVQFASPNSFSKEQHLNANYESGNKYNTNSKYASSSKLKSVKQDEESEDRSSYEVKAASSDKIFAGDTGADEDQSSNQFANNVKFLIAVIVSLAITLAVNFAVHSYDMTLLAASSEKLHTEGESIIEKLSVQMDELYPDLNFTDIQTMSEEHPVKKTLTELTAKLTVEQERKQSDLEKELVAIFNSTPAYASSSAIKVWKELGPFPIGTQIEWNKIILDYRYPVKCETKSA